MFFVRISITLLSSISICYAQNQQIVPYKITHLKNQLYKSQYSSIQFLDSRKSVTDLGFIFLDKKFVMPVQPAYPLEQQVYNLFDSIIEMPIKREGLLFQLHRLQFFEFPNANCSIRIQLYKKNDNGYQKLALLDTTISLGAFSLRKKLQMRLFDSCSYSISNFLGSSLKNTVPTDTFHYSIDEVIHIEDVDKTKIPIYIKSTFKDGFYRTYSSFKKQLPDSIPGLIVKFKNNEPKSVQKKYYNGDGQADEVEIDPSELYAIVSDGKPYIYTDFGCYSISKKDNDFFFTGSAKIAPNSNGSPTSINGQPGPGQMALGLGGRLIGGAITGLAIDIVGGTSNKISDRHKYEMKIDYLNGRFILTEQK